MEGSFKHGLVATSPARSFEPHTTHEDGSKDPSADRSAFFSFVCAWTNSDINVSIPHCLNVAVVSCKRLIALVFAARSIFVLASWNQKGFFGFLKNKKPETNEVIILMGNSKICAGPFTCVYGSERERRKTTYSKSL
jgi:hypothetical protein